MGPDNFALLTRAKSSEVAILRTILEEPLL